MDKKKFKNRISYKYLLYILCMYLIPMFFGGYYIFVILFELIILLLLLIKYQNKIKEIAQELKQRGKTIDIDRFTKGYFGEKININNAIIPFEINTYNHLTVLIKNRRMLKQISYSLAKDFFMKKEALFIVSRLFQMTLFIFFLSIGIYLASH